MVFDPITRHRKTKYIHPDWIWWHSHSSLNTKCKSLALNILHIVRAPLWRHALRTSCWHTTGYIPRYKHMVTPNYPSHTHSVAHCAKYRFWCAISVTAILNYMSLYFISHPLHRIRQIRAPNAPFSYCGRLDPKGPSSQLTVLLIEAKSESRETQRIDLYTLIRTACHQRGARSLRNVLIDSDMHFIT